MSSSTYHIPPTFVVKWSSNVMFSTKLAFVNLHSITFLFRYSNTTAMIPFPTNVTSDHEPSLRLSYDFLNKGTIILLNQKVFGICNTPELETHPSLGQICFHCTNIIIIIYVCTCYGICKSNLASSAPT